ncbi:MAG: signal peptide peptidase SppA [Dysgonamonadaceae bacterium]|jgi:protease-4|nr:signal peptide peptidase SppA [Dysgonamonadaceae bacterium]
MKDFFKMMIASAFGVILGIIILSFLAVFLFLGMAVTMSTTQTCNLSKQTVLELDLQGIINEREAAANPLDLLTGGKNNNLGLNDITNAIKKAKENDKIPGIYLKAGNLSAGIATLEPIRKALIDFKESGKFIVAYGDYYTQAVYYLASVADSVFMNPQGRLSFHGLAGGTMFLKNTLDKLGIKMQVFKVGKYKSAVEPYILEQMSEENREQITAFLTDIWGHYLKGISESRNIPVDKLNHYADEFMDLAVPETAVEYGFVDALKFASQVEACLKEKVGIDADHDLKKTTVKELKTLPFLHKKPHKETIAVLYAEGAIVSDDAEGGPFNSGQTITAKTFVKELNALKVNKDVKAVVFRVNSGGGSAFASEQIWNAVKELKAEKPIIVSMGDYAASGGYYISCEATKIVAEPSTLTGSIGIFGIVPDGEELAKKIGVKHDMVMTNRFTDFGGPVLPLPFLGGVATRGMTTDEKIILQSYIERGYDLFTTRCADGRSMTKAEIDSIGQGRVWTGIQALQLGLIDQLGGLDDAVEIAAKEAGISNYSISEYPAIKDFFTQLMEDSFSGMRVFLTRQCLGLDGYEQQVLRHSLKQLDVRQAIMPYAITND